MPQRKDFSFCHDQDCFTLRYRAGCYWYTNGAVYEGEYRNGRVHGKGRATFPSGDSYAGEWSEGAMSGTGVYEFKAEGAR